MKASSTSQLFWRLKEVLNNCKNSSRGCNEPVGLFGFPRTITSNGSIKCAHAAVAGACHVSRASARRSAVQAAGGDARWGSTSGGRAVVVAKRRFDERHFAFMKNSRGEIKRVNRAGSRKNVTRVKMVYVCELVAKAHR